MNITFTEEALQNIEERGIEKADVETVVNTAEETKEKIFSDEGLSLARQRIGNYTVYAEYKIDGDNAEVAHSYSHRVTLTGDGE